MRRGVEERQPYVELVSDGTERSFVYRVQHQQAPVPVYSGRVSHESDVYSRLVVFLLDGGQGYDVMGYTHTQLIDDVLDQYERHLAFLRRAEAGSAGA